ncbi:VMAP-C domain-containing protein [Streptomyces fuscichromogenes]|uniref:Serine protease n=1 Tax=Streptomyces fuscichromogenes TaxID=1324013 RepID=A0A917X9H2_9ACTN|nr:trypsin-like peptidase domain-containing protein [Streptomyces fuscichromogenes]GGM94840.1 serine protease [Streptomyces fuscichromogenes]
MSRAAWHARIACGGEVSGAGFLVTSRTVLTCAHVVRNQDLAPLTVSFPNRRDLGELTASVAVHGGWTGGWTDPGDLAVLELDREVPLQPARFAPPGAEQGGADLEAYGFPDGYEEGVLARYRAVSRTLIADEWLQLEAASAHGQPIAHGFSGAAVTLPDGRVVGMVAQVAGEPGVLTGRMLPTEVMARYWYDLGALVPAPATGTPAASGRLHALVRRAEAAALDCRPAQLYRDAVGPFGPEPPPDGFGSLRQAAAYVQWQVDDPEAVPRFADRLAGLLEPRPSAPAPDSAWAPIVVELEHSGEGQGQVTVQVSAYREGRRRRVAVARLPRGEVRAYVQRRVDDAFALLAPDAEALLTFVLPRDWLNEPVAQWACGPEDATPLGCAHPLVVADLSRHRSARLRHQLAHRWRTLEGDPARTVLHRVDCGSPERPLGLRKRLRDEAAGLAGFGAPPEAAPDRFEAGLNVPVPVLLWPRTGCATADHAGPCAGSTFLDALSLCVDGIPPTELPRHIWRLREEAAADDDPEGHWARDVQLLWDDPRCYPEPQASLHTPVA